MADTPSTTTRKSGRAPKQRELGPGMTNTLQAMDRAPIGQAKYQTPSKAKKARGEDRAGGVVDIWKGDASDEREGLMLSRGAVSGMRGGSPGGGVDDHGEGEPRSRGSASGTRGRGNGSRGRRGGSVAGRSSRTNSRTAEPPSVNGVNDPSPLSNLLSLPVAGPSGSQDNANANTTNNNNTNTIPPALAPPGLPFPFAFSAPHPHPQAVPSSSSSKPKPNPNPDAGPNAGTQFLPQPQSGSGADRGLQGYGNGPVGEGTASEGGGFGSRAVGEEIVGVDGIVGAGRGGKERVVTDGMMDGGSLAHIRVNNLPNHPHAQSQKAPALPTATATNTDTSNPDLTTPNLNDDPKPLPNPHSRLPASGSRADGRDIVGMRRSTRRVGSVTVGQASGSGSKGAGMPQAEGGSTRQKMDVGPRRSSQQNVGGNATAANDISTKEAGGASGLRGGRGDEDESEGGAAAADRIFSKQQKGSKASTHITTPSKGSRSPSKSVKHAQDTESVKKGGVSGSQGQAGRDSQVDEGRHLGSRDTHSKQPGSRQPRNPPAPVTPAKRRLDRETEDQATQEEESGGGSGNGQVGVGGGGRVLRSAGPVVEEKPKVTVVEVKEGDEGYVEIGKSVTQHEFMPGEIIQLSPDQFHIVDAARYPVHQFYKVMKRLGRGASAIVYELEPLIRKLRKIVLVEGKRMEGEVVEEGMIGGVDSEDSSLEEVFVKDAAFPSISMKVQFWKRDVLANAVITEFNRRVQITAGLEATRTRSGKTIVLPATGYGPILRRRPGEIGWEGCSARVMLSPKGESYATALKDAHHASIHHPDETARREAATRFKNLWSKASAVVSLFNELYSHLDIKEGNFVIVKTRDSDGNEQEEVSIIDTQGCCDSGDKMSAVSETWVYTTMFAPIQLVAALISTYITGWRNGSELFDNAVAHEDILGIVGDYHNVGIARATSEIDNWSVGIMGARILNPKWFKDNYDLESNLPLVTKPRTLSTVDDVWAAVRDLAEMRQKISLTYGAIYETEAYLQGVDPLYTRDARFMKDLRLHLSRPTCPALLSSIDYRKASKIDWLNQVMSSVGAELEAALKAPLKPAGRLQHKGARFHGLAKHRLDVAAQTAIPTHPAEHPIQAFVASTVQLSRSNLRWTNKSSFFEWNGDLGLFDPIQSGIYTPAERHILFERFKLWEVTGHSFVLQEKTILQCPLPKTSATSAVCGHRRYSRKDMLTHLESCSQALGLEGLLVQFA